MDFAEKKNQLMTRLTENYADYKANLLTKDRQELIDGAERIAATTNAFEYIPNVLGVSSKAVMPSDNTTQAATVFMRKPAPDDEAPARCSAFN